MEPPIAWGGDILDRLICVDRASAIPAIQVDGRRRAVHSFMQRSSDSPGSGQCHFTAVSLPPGAALEPQRERHGLGARLAAVGSEQFSIATMEVLEAPQAPQRAMDVSGSCGRSAGRMQFRSERRTRICGDPRLHRPSMDCTGLGAELLDRGIWW